MARAGLPRYPEFGLGENLISPDAEPDLVLLESDPVVLE
jgi:hypothetical protein